MKTNQLVIPSSNEESPMNVGIKKYVENLLGLYPNQ